MVYADVNGKKTPIKSAADLCKVAENFPDAVSSHVKGRRISPSPGEIQNQQPVLEDEQSTNEQSTADEHGPDVRNRDTFPALIQTINHQEMKGHCYNNFQQNGQYQHYNNYLSPEYYSSRQGQRGRGKSRRGK